MPSSVAIGTLIGVCFAFAWAIAGLQGIPTRWGACVLAVAVLVSVLIGIGVIWRLRSAPASSFTARFLWACAVLSVVGSGYGPDRLRLRDHFMDVDCVSFDLGSGCGVKDSTNRGPLYS